MGFDDYAMKREASRGALSAFYDLPASYLNELSGELRQRIRTFSQDTPSDIFYAVRLLAGIRGASVIVHGPRGCAAQASAPHTDSGLLSFATTNLTEQNTILGGENQLRETIFSTAAHYKPSVIFVVTTPPVSINSDDISAVITEASDELDIPIVGVLSTGFLSRLGVTGYDSAILPLFNKFARDENDLGAPFVNLISVTETAAEIEGIVRVIEQLGFRANTLPNTASIEAFSRAGAASGTVVINAGEGLLLAEKLKEKFEVPFIVPSLPIGKSGRAAFADQIAELLGTPQREHNAENEKIEKIISLSGKKVAIDAQPDYAIALARIVKDSGGEVVAVSASYIDKTNAAGFDADAKLRVGEFQGFELDNLLNEIDVDLFISQTGDVLPALRRAIPTVAFGNVSILSEAGFDRFAHNIGKVLKNNAFAQRYRGIGTAPYTDSWFRRRVSWYIKQEVI
jgi:nitrogenase molybdenum-iron protein alpha chain